VIEYEVSLVADKSEIEAGGVLSETPVNSNMSRQ
jgi:hypothetical protein